MSSDISLATVAEYFRIGLQVGLLLPEQATEWATAVISDLATPPYEVIDVSWSKGLASTLEALSSVKGERDKKLAGHLLLGLIRDSLPESDSGLHLAVQRAMSIAREAELGDETYYSFDIIDDELSLARTKVYGTVEQCRADMVNELAEYPNTNVFANARLPTRVHHVE
jgi:hypothetical protein